MLFLQALLFFILGISVVAIPISPMISDISPRSNNLNHHSGQQSPHTTGGVAKLEYPKDGLWTGFYCPPGGGTHETYYMKIIRGDVVGFWPKLDNEEVKTELFKNNDWNREEDLESTRKREHLPDGMYDGFNGARYFPKGYLRTASITSDAIWSEQYRGVYKPTLVELGIGTSLLKP